MAEKTRCEDCDRTFKDAEGLAMHNKAKHPESIPKKKKSIELKKYKWLIYTVLAIFLIWGVISIIPKNPSLPPTTIEGHREISPPSHILKEPMSLAVQKHMLEHVDGKEGGKGGVIINYNCKDYTCEEGLIEKLESFASKYDYVYVAPFKGMDAKIALTRLGKIETFNEYNEEIIERFIK